MKHTNYYLLFLALGISMPQCYSMDLHVQLQHIQESTNIVRTIDALILKELLSDLLERDELLTVQSVDESVETTALLFKPEQSQLVAYNDVPVISNSFEPPFSPTIPMPGDWPSFPEPIGHVTFPPAHMEFIDPQPIYHNHNPTFDEVIMVQDMATDTVVDQAQLVEGGHMIEAKEIYQDDNYECQGARMVPHGLDIEEEIEWYINDGCPDSLECADILIKQLQHRGDRRYYRRMLINKKRILSGKPPITIPAAGEITSSGLYR